MRNYNYSITSSCSPFQFNHSCAIQARDIFEEKLKNKEPWSGFLSVSLMYTAFWYESYINYLCQELFEQEWGDELDKERKSTYYKANFLFDKLNKDNSHLSEHLSIIGKIFKYRNLIAHGKLVKSDFEGVIDEDMYKSQAEDLSKPLYMQVQNEWRDLHLELHKSSYLEIVEKVLEFFYDSFVSKFPNKNLSHPLGSSEGSAYNYSLVELQS